MSESLPLPAPALLRAGFRLMGAVVPGLAASAGRRLFFMPPRTRRRPEQRAVLASARRLEIVTSRGKIAGWSWGRGETVLLLHGWGGHAGQLTPFVGPLLERGFRVLALDLPAHGESPGRQASVRHFADAIAEAVEPFAPLAGIVAHSLGSSAAALALSRGLESRAAVFLSPPSRFGPIFERVSRTFGWGESLRRRFERGAEAWVGLRFDDVEPRRLAGAQRTPLLVVHDRSDDEIRVEEGEELARLWPGARVRLTEGLGHYRILRDPATVVETVAFLTEASTGPD